MMDIFQEPWPCGVTVTSKEEFTRLRLELGEIKKVVVKNLVTNPVDTETIVVGSEAHLHLDGFSMGYRGEGPHGMIWLLKELNIPFSDEDVFKRQTEDVVEFVAPKGD